MKTSLKFLVVLSLSLVGAHSAQAQTYFWDPVVSSPTQTDGNGTWNTSNTNWSSGAAQVIWPNSTSDIATFGTTASTIGYTVTVSGTVNAGGITVLGFSNTPDYTLSGGSAGATINASSGTFVFDYSKAAFFGGNAINNLKFVGASSYQFLGTTAVNGNGATFGGTTSFDNNVVIGTGADKGEMQDSNATLFSTTGKSITINNGWSVYFSNSGLNYKDALVLNGLGTRANGTVSFGGANENYSGAITLGSDASIMNTASNNTVSGNITGNANLYLGYWNNSGTVDEKLVVSGTNSYTGATIIVSGIAGGSTDISKQAVALGSNSALPTTTTLVMGMNGSSGPVAGMPSPRTGLAGDASWTFGSVAGALDLNGFNATVAGLTQGVAIDPTIAAKNVIGNNSGTGVSTLTINGTGNNSYSGIIEDDFTGSSTVGNVGGKTALAVTGGTENLTGSSNVYSGGTTVTGTGVLLVNNASGSATGSGAVTVGAGGKIGGGTTAATTGGTASLSKLGSTGHVPTLSTYGSLVGKIGGPLTIQSGGHLAPGNSVGTITTASLSLASGAQLDYEFNSTANDFTIVSGNLDLDSANGGGVLVNLFQEGTTTAFDQVGTYDIFSYGTLSGTGADLLVNNGQAGFAYNFVDDSADHLIQLQISAIPEPSTWALLLGGVAILVIYQRRRSSQATR